MNFACMFGRHGNYEFDSEHIYCGRCGKQVTSPDSKHPIVGYVKDESETPEQATSMLLAGVKRYGYIQKGEPRIVHYYDLKIGGYVDYFYVDAVKPNIVERFFRKLLVN